MDTIFDLGIKYSMVLRLALDIRRILDARVLIFDFDGVLVDSYSCLPAIYMLIAKKIGMPDDLAMAFSIRAIAMEDEADYMMNYDRTSWWPELFRSFGINIDSWSLQKLSDLYQEERINRSRILPKVRDLLECFLRMDKILVIVAGSDGIKGKKRERIEKSGLAHYFRDIFIVGDDVPSREDAIRIVLQKYGVKQREIVVIDDKPHPINTVKKAFPEIFAIRVLFRTILTKAWEGKAAADIEVRSMYELYRLLRNFC